MTTRVLVVNHGPEEVEVDTYRARVGLAGMLAPDILLKTEPVRAHQELSCLVYEGHYVCIREVKK